MWAHYLCTMSRVQFKCKSNIIWTLWTNVSHPPYVMSMFKKLLGMRSFNITVGHLACDWVILFTSSNGLYLPSMVQLVAPTFLGCWTLIILALITHFQQDWSPHSFQCGDTCRDQHFSLTASIMRYPSFINLVCLFQVPPFESLVIHINGWFDGLFT
jgi:hypothetical protein